MRLNDLYKILLNNMISGNCTSKFICVNILRNNSMSESDSKKLYDDFYRRKEEAKALFPTSWLGGDAWWRTNEAGNNNRINFLKHIIGNG